MLDNPSPSLFFGLSLTALIAYSLQYTLVASFYRQMDRLSAVAYRGVSLGITMAPLLLFVPFKDQEDLAKLAPMMLVASIITTVGNWCAANAVAYLSVGVSNALSMSFVTVTAVLLGFAALGEVLSPIQLGLIAATLLGVVGLGLAKSKDALIDKQHATKGLLQSVLAGVFLGIGFVMVASASRKYHPFLVGYVWEFTIGLIAVLMCWMRKLQRGPGLEPVSLKKFTRLALYCAPTAVGTGAYAAATTIGPVGIATAIVCTMMVCTTLLARVMYKERLSRPQWAFLLVVCGLVAALRYFSD